jgi:hypothetical protein
VIGLFVVARVAGDERAVAARRAHAAPALVVSAPEHSLLSLLLRRGKYLIISIRFNFININ